MKILFLSFYYKPDLCAGSFRTQGLIRELGERLTDGDEVTLLTTLPQRYQSFKVEADQSEVDGVIQVERFKTPVHKSGFVDQIKCFYSYYKQVLDCTKDENYDFVFATSSRLFTAFLGARLARKKRIPLLLDIRDIFRDTLKSLLPKLTFALLNSLIYLIENYTFSYAKKINLVSEGFNDYFQKRFSNTKYYNFYNGVDDIFFNFDFTKEVSSRKIITYAGNIGKGQCIESIIPQMAEYLGCDYEIHIYGDGGQCKALEEAIADNKVTNVKLFSPVNREKLLLVYKNSDYLFLHLNDVSAFEKVLPSKVFEYAITKKPIIAGVNGFARQFIEDNIPLSVVFDPSSIASFSENFEKFVCTEKDDDIDDFVRRFSRKSISREMVGEMFEIDK